MEFLDLPPIANVSGTVRMPGSKSLSNRMLLLAALAAGTTELDGLLESDDTSVMLDALKALGVAWHKDNARVNAGHNARDGSPRYVVPGAGGPFSIKAADLFMGLSGLSMRTLTAALAFSSGRYRLDGVARMRERPIGDLVDALRPLGADIRYEQSEGFPPLRVEVGTPSANSLVRIRGDVSSQFLTGLLQALPLRPAGATVDVEGELVSKPYVEITLNLMRQFGVEVERDGWQRFRVPPASRYRSPGCISVEGDASSASYFLAAGAIGGGPVRVEGVGRGSVQGDVAFADTLAAMGATIQSGDDWIEAQGHGRLRGIDCDFNMIPDAAMTAAVVALFADGPTTLRNIGSWRVKETDRIAAMAAELRKVGATVDDGPDWLRVTPPEALTSATIDTYDDHRMAMCFSLVALGGVGVRINDPRCVRKTFPEYFAELRRLAS